METGGNWAGCGLTGYMLSVEMPGIQYSANVSHTAFQHNAFHADIIVKAGVQRIINGKLILCFWGFFASATTMSPSAIACKQTCFCFLSVFLQAQIVYFS